MATSSQTLHKLGWLACIALAAALGAAAPISAQGATDQVRADANDGVASDWTHRHLIFSNPGTAEEAQQNGSFDRWAKITDDARYRMQQRQRKEIGVESRNVREPDAWKSQREHEADADDDDDGDAVARTPQSEEDFPGGVLPRGLMRAAIPPPRGHDQLPSDRDERRPRKNTHQLTRDWSETLASGGSVGMGNFPATFSSGAASCTTDFAVYNTSLAGSSSQASVIAYNQLYSGCTSRPSTYWAYDTGGAASTSITISQAGSQIAYVQKDKGTGNADLVVLKWAASSGTLATPTLLTSNSAFPNCTAPCMISIPLSGSVSDTNSSPYVDYGSATAYVGDDAGKIHQFTNIFSTTTPVETTSGWPVALNTSTDAALSSPVYDSASGNIFVGDYLINTSSNCQPGVKTTEGLCGYLYSIKASTQAVVKSAQLDYNLGIADAPIVDSTAGTVYAFVGADNSTSCSSGPCAAVFQFPVSFGAGAAGTEATVGAGYQTLLSGTFDNQYFTSGSSPSGHLYVVGATGPQNNTLYAVTITSNAMTAGTANAGPVVATNYTNGFYATGLQVTEFCNNGSTACTSTVGTDYLFLGVLAFGSQFTTNPCPSQSVSVGCVMGFTAPNSGVVASTASPNGSLQEAGGPSGIVIDSGVSEASNIYFSTLLNQTCTTSGGTGGCAISATQSGLQ